MCRTFAVGPCGFAGLVKFNFLDFGCFAFTYGVGVYISLCAVGSSPDFLFLNHNRSNFFAVNYGFACCCAVKGFNNVTLCILNSVLILGVVLGNL